MACTMNVALVLLIVIHEAPLQPHLSLISSLEPSTQPTEGVRP
jgi:hypothetical protein